jgi:lysophospholipase L1-like esterase
MRHIPIAVAALLLSQGARAKPVESIRYLALGDSLTIGTGSSPSQSFPARLAARWRARGAAVELANLGVNGYTTQDLLDEELPAVRAFRPTLVTLAVGANDLVRGGEPERYRAQLRRIFARLVEAGVPGPRVIAIPQPDWSLSPTAALFGDAGDLGARIRLFNRVLREESAAAGARYVDLFPLMERQARAHLLAPDGLHPSAKAHDEWAEALRAAISD